MSQSNNSRGGRNSASNNSRGRNSASNNSRGRNSTSNVTLDPHPPAEPLHLPDGVDTRLSDIATAISRVAPHDLTVRPALQIAEATIVINAARPGSTTLDACAPEDVPGYLACAAAVIKSVIASVIDIPQGDLPQGALLSREEILGMAQSLRRELYCVWLKSRVPDVEVCEFERRMREREPRCGSARVADIVKKTGVFIKGIDDIAAADDTHPLPDVGDAFGKLRRPQAVPRGDSVDDAAGNGDANDVTNNDANDANDGDDGTGADAGVVVHRSPHLHRAAASVEEKSSMIATILPKQLNNGLVASARAPLRWLRERTFAFDRNDGKLPVHFAVEEWEAPLTFHPAAGAAAEKVAKALKQLSTQAESQPPDEAEEAERQLEKKRQAEECVAEEAAKRHRLDGQEASARQQLGEERADAERRQKLPPEERRREEMAAWEAKMEKWKADMNADAEAARAEAKAEVKAAMAEAKAEAKAEAIAEMKDEMDADRLVAKVNAAKDEYCDAVLNALDLPMPLLQALHVTFSESLYPTATIEADKKTGIAHPQTVVSGCCPIRTAALCVSAANTGFVPASEENCQRLRTCLVGPERSAATKRLYNELSKIPARIRGKCTVCGTVGRCLAMNSVIACVGSPQWGNLSQRQREFETKAHIIPHAAANYVETHGLLKLIDAMPSVSPARCVEYLALPHNIFYLSSCFENLFDRGALVFVKIGPPDFQFYRVTMTEKAVVNVDFGGDIELRELVSHLGEPVTLSSIDGLVVDLARPAAVTVRRTTHEIARVSHRYLDLHARAHHPSLRRKPLVTYENELSPAALADQVKKQVKNAVLARSQEKEGAAVTIEQWLDELEKP